MRFPFRLSIVASFLVFAVGCRAADTVAVLPLFNIDENRSRNLDWIGESVAETIHESLNTSGMLVLSREDREEVYHRLSLRTGVVLTRASVMKIGEGLDAGQIVFGEYRVEGAEPDATREAISLKSPIRITVRIIDLKKLRAGPELSATGPLEDLSSLESKLTWMVLRQMAPGNTPAEEEFVRGRLPVRVDAMESYVRGLMAASPDQKTKLFTQAARLDERFSQPAFQLGRLAFAKKDYRAAGQWLAKVTKSDSHFMEASFLRAICRYHEGDFGGAAEQFRMVAAEIPLNEVLNNLGAALSRRNDPAALENFGKALEGDQADPDYWFNLGYSLWKRGQFTQAAEQFRGVLDRSPGDQEATIMLGRCLKMDGPRAGDPRSDGRERLKITFEDSAFRQLQAELKGKTPEAP